MREKRKKTTMQWEKDHGMGNKDTTALLSTYRSAVGAVSTAMDSGASVHLGGSWETWSPTKAWLIRRCNGTEKCYAASTKTGVGCS